MKEMKPYVDIYRVTEEEQPDTFNLVVHFKSKDEIDEGISLFESFQNDYSTGKYVAKLQIKSLAANQHSSAVLHKREINIGNVGFSQTTPLMQVSLYDEDTSAHLGKSTTHQDDIEEEGLPDPN